MTKNIMLGTSIGAFCVVSALGCAHVPPEELRDARAAYKQAAAGVASRETPAQLHTANNALQEAEQSFEAEGDSAHTRDLAYVATRKAQLAEVQARVAENESRLAAAEAHMKRDQKRELTKLRDQHAAQQHELGATQAAREAADARADLANADLARIASVKQDHRGTVITLSGQVLFASGKSELLGGAQAKLGQVATALTQQDRDAQIVVEGHTDSQGSEAFNLELSRRRAQAVSDYLSSHGVAADRIRAEGLGFSRPLGANTTAEGRANNRRVEIIVNPAAQSVPPS